MMPWQRGPEQYPGDLYLDPALPDSERVRIACGSWTAEVTHVWTGIGWSRLLTTPVRLVPGACAETPTGTLAVRPRLAS